MSDKTSQTLLKIAQGAFGCVYKPKRSICDPNGNTVTDIDSVIQKAIMNDRKEDSDSNAIIEHKENAEIVKIDPKSEFTTKYHGMCSIDAKNKATKSIKSTCPQVSESNNIGILTYDDGGIDIDKYITELTGKSEEDSYPLYIQLIISILELMEHIPKMKDADFIHRDIKPANVVYNKKNRKAKLIDFGLSKSISYICEHNDKWYTQAQWPYETFYINEVAFNKRTKEDGNTSVGIYDYLLDNIQYDDKVADFLIPNIEKQRNNNKPIIKVKGKYITDTHYYTDAIPGTDDMSKWKRTKAYRALYPDFYYFNVFNYTIFGEQSIGFLRYIQSQKESFIAMMETASKKSNPHQTFVKNVVDGIDIYCMGGVFADVLNIACSTINNKSHKDVFIAMFRSLYTNILTSNIYDRNVATFISEMMQIIVDSPKFLDLSHTSSSDELPLPPPSLPPPRRWASSSSEERLIPPPPPPPPPRSSSGGKKTRKRRKAKRRKTNRYMKKRYR